jgi:molybdopterin-guanine dinucleotide biosynthesis protein A
MSPTDAANPLWSDVTLAVLAGGEGQRMGRPKGSLKIEGRPILRYLLERFQFPRPTYLITAPGREHPEGCEEFDLEWVDPVAGQGPLRGVLTALEHLTTSRLIVTTVDMPGIGHPQLEHLLSSAADASMVGWMYVRANHPGLPERIEPFPMLLGASSADAIRTYWEQGRRSVAGLLSLRGFARVEAPSEWEPQAWVNLNSPADLEAFLRGTSD